MNVHAWQLEQAPSLWLQQSVTYVMQHNPVLCTVDVFLRGCVVTLQLLHALAKHIQVGGGHHGSSRSPRITSDHVMKCLPPGTRVTAVCVDLVGTCRLSCTAVLKSTRQIHVQLSAPVSHETRTTVVLIREESSLRNGFCTTA